MDKKRAIELLIQAVDEIPYLKTLHFNNDEFPLWHKKVEDIIRAGLEPDDNSKYWPVSQALEILRGVYEDNIYQEEYLKKITNYEVALKSILLKYEILGMEEREIRGGEVEKMDESKAIELLRQALTEIPNLKELHYDNQKFKLWCNRVETIIKYGLDEDDYNTFESVQSLYFLDDIVDIGIEQSEDYPKKLKDYETALLSIIQKHEILRIPEVSETTSEKPVTIADKPKAFIAHGGDSPALSKLKSFLEALGVEPLVVEEQPSEGRSIAENVGYYARQSDFAIILATKGDIDGVTGGFIPRGNVLIEIGKSQELFKDRIIYLLQAGTKFPTNISEKVRERFTSQNMDNAFIKIAKELKKFGILRAVKP